MTIAGISYYQRQGVLIAASGCAALTVLSFLLVHGFKFYPPGHCRRPGQRLVGRTPQ